MLKLFEKYSFEILLSLVFVYFSFGYLPYAYSNIALVVLTVVFLLAFFLIKKFRINSKLIRKEYLLILIPIALTVLSVLLSKNKVLGLSHVWHKLPIVIVPFIILNVLESKSQLKKVAGIFIFSSLIAILYTFFNLLEVTPVLYKFSTTIAKEVTIIQHPYFGIYQILAIVLLVEFYKDSMNKVLFYGLLVIFSLGVLVSTSRISYVLYFLIAILFTVKILSKTNAMIFLVLISGFFVVFLGTNKPIQDKFTRSLVYETSPRLKLWKNSYLVLSNSDRPLLGVTTDYFNEGVKDPYWLKGHIKKLKDDYVGLKGYSSHNQYIDFILLNGIFGLLYLVLLLYAIWVALKNCDVFLISLALVISIFSFTESILHRQYGLILYVILMPIILKLGKTPKKQL